MAGESQPFFLKSGESISIVTTFDGLFEENVGARYFMASPETNLGYYPQSGNAGFEVSHLQKWSWYSGDTGQSYFSYQYTVTNVGEIDTSFIAEYGGVV